MTKWEFLCLGTANMHLWDTNTHLHTHRAFSKLATSSDSNLSENEIVDCQKCKKWLLWPIAEWDDSILSVCKIFMIQLQGDADLSSPRSSQLEGNSKYPRQPKKKEGGLLLRMHIFRESWTLKNLPVIASLSYKATFLSPNRMLLLLALITEKHNHLFK